MESPVANREAPKPSGSYNNKQSSGVMANIELITPASTTELKNPLRSDPELMTLVKKVESIKKYKSFHKWKPKFLARLDEFLYQSGMKPADECCTDFGNLLEKQLKFAAKVSAHIEKGELGDDRKTVKAALALSEMCKVLTMVVEETQTLVPGTKKEEKMKGFTKFHLGAALVRQGFHQYGSMCAIETFCKEIREPLHYVADRQQHELFEYYALVFERWIDVIKDMGLYEIMLACQKFRYPPDEEESSSVDPIIVNLTVKTADGSKKIPLEVESTESIANIKEYIASGCGIPSDKQVLTWNGDELNDGNNTLEDLGIQDAATFVVDTFKIPITVKTMDGKSIKMMVNPSAYLSDLKLDLEPESGIPAANQCLRMKDNVLDDPMKVLEEYGIAPGSVLTLEPKTIDVQVKTPDGKLHPVTLSPSDDIDVIKKKVHLATKMPVEKQVLSKDGNNLPDKTAVRDMGIMEGDELDADLFKIPVTIRTPDGNQFKAMVDPTDYLSDIKMQLEPKSGIPAKNQRLSKGDCELKDPMKTLNDYGVEAGDTLELEPTSMSVTVNTPDGSSHTIMISPLDDTSGIKKKIEKVTGLPASKQVLLHKGKELPSQKSAKDIGLQEGDELDVEIYKVPVTVNVIGGNQIELMVDPTDPMGEIKRNLEPKSGIEAPNQRLYMHGNELSDDSKTAGDYGIKEGSVLDLEPKSMNVKVTTPDGNTITIAIDPNKTTDDVKKIVQDKSGIKTTDQILKLDGRPLPHGKTLKEAGVAPGDSLVVDIVMIPVTVHTFDGQTIETMVDPTKSILDLKRQLEPECGVTAGNQRLLKGDTELKDEAKAGDCGVKPGSVLDLEVKQLKVNIRGPSGEVFSIDIEPSYTGEMIKEKIKQEIGLSVPRQVLKKDGKEIKDMTTAKAAGIMNGDNLDVEIRKVPITVTTMDGKKINAMIDPYDKVGDIKRQLEKDTGISADNQVLFKDGNELDNGKRANDYGISGGEELDIEPRFMRVTAHTPDGNVYEVDIRPNDNLDDIKGKIEEKSGLLAVRQVPKLEGKALKDGLKAKSMGIRDGSKLVVDIYTIPIGVVFNDKEFSIDIEPIQSINSIKKMCQKPSGVDARKQILSFNDEELSDGKKSADAYGIVRDSKLYLDILRDDIIFVDVKCGTLFGMDRQEVIDHGALTPLDGNKLDFMEANKDSSAREKLSKAMLESRRLGVNRQVVVEGVEVEDYDLAEAQAVSSLWGVSLKKVQKNKKGEEFIFIDPKTGACGELSRKNYLERNFITLIEDEKEGKTLAEREVNVQAYDKMVKEIRRVFNI